MKFHFQLRQKNMELICGRLLAGAGSEKIAWTEWCRLEDDSILVGK
jgi:hypothetical protein